jgi:thiamine-phosphate pyrophosphorylase
MIGLNYTDKFFFFTNIINDISRKNLNNFRNLSIIYKTENNNLNIKEFLKIKNFCRKKRIKIYFPDDFKIAIKLGADGLFISSSNNKLYHDYKKSFKFIGSAHSQKEFFFRSRQKCDYIFLSPIFKTEKYSNNKILGLSKFNLLSLNWAGNLIALGGINENNLRKVFLTKCCGVGFVSWMKNLKIKKPVYFIKNTRAFIKNL